MEIIAANIVVTSITDAVVGKAALPDRKLRRETMREAAFDELHGTLDSDVGGSDEEMKVVGHHDVGVQQVAGAVVVDGIEEQLGIAFDLKESAAIVSGCGDEVSAWSGGAARNRHSAIVKRTSAAKAALLQ